MNDRPNHAIAGLAFLAACVIIAVVVFLVAQNSRSARQASNAVAMEADAVADRMEAENQAIDHATLAGVRSPERTITSAPSLEAVKGQNYRSVRKRLLAAGYQPIEQAQQDCSPYGTSANEECADRPEIVTCAGTGKAFCLGYWTRGDETLKVVMSDGPDGIFDHAELVSRSETDEWRRMPTTDSAEPEQQISTVPDIQFANGRWSE